MAILAIGSVSDRPYPDEKIFKILKEGDPRISDAALSVISHCSKCPPEITQILIDSLSSSNSNIRYAAAYGLRAHIEKGTASISKEQSNKMYDAMMNEVDQRVENQIIQAFDRL